MEATMRAVAIYLLAIWGVYVAWGVLLVRAALRDAPEPHWSAIRAELEAMKPIPRVALRVGAWLTPPADDSGRL